MPNLLIVYPEAFSQGWRGAASRLLTLSNGLRQKNWAISMLSASNWSEVDQSEQEKVFPAEIHRTVFSGEYPLFVEQYPTLKKVWRGTWRLRGINYYYKMLGMGWASNLEKNIAKIAINLNKPDAIWAICTSNMNGLIAGRFLSNYFNCKLVLEFQDPPSSKNETLIPFLEKQLVQCMIKADLIITTTQSYRAYLIQKYSIPTDKIKTLYLSYDDNRCFSQHRHSSPIETSKIRKLILMHAGSLKLGNARNARAVVSAIHKAFSLRDDIKMNIFLYLVGGGKGALDAYELATNLNIRDSVVVIPEVSNREVVNLIETANVLLVIKHGSPNFDMQIPGKLFQYLSYGKPILGIMRANTEASNILLDSNLGLVCSESDIDRLAEILIYLYDNFHALGAKHSPNLNYIRQYSATNIVDQCNNYLCGIINK